MTISTAVEEWLQGGKSETLILRSTSEVQREYKVVRREYKEVRREYKGVRREYREVRREYDGSTRVRESRFSPLEWLALTKDVMLMPFANK